MQGSEYVAEMNGHIDVLSTYQTECFYDTFFCVANGALVDSRIRYWIQDSDLSRTYHFSFKSQVDP